MTVSEILGVPYDDTGVSSSDKRGYGKQGIQRWLMSSLLNAGGSPQGAYDEIVHRFLLCLAGSIVGKVSGRVGVALTPVRCACCVCLPGSYVLGLGPRKPGDVFITPQGFVMFGCLSSVDSGFDLMTRGRAVGEFGSTALCHELLSVLGFAHGKVWSTIPLLRQLVSACTSALTALRRDPTELLVATGCNLVCFTPFALMFPYRDFVSCHRH